MNKRGVSNSKVLEAWEQTQDLEKAAALCGLKVSTMQKRIYACGISPFPKLVDNETVLRIWEGCGRHTETAAEKLGLHPNSVRYRLTECMGIELKRQGGGRRPRRSDEELLAAWRKAPTLDGAAELLGYADRSNIIKRLRKIRQREVESQTLRVREAG